MPITILSDCVNRDLTRAFSAPFFSPCFLKTKKRERGIVVVLLLCFYGFFLSKSKPTMAIAMIIAIITAAIPIVRPDIVARPDTGAACRC